jgi:hypothetical protein
MASIMDELLGQLGSGGLDQLASSVGADRGQVEGALGAALPALLEGLNRNAATPDGRQALFEALGKDHDGSLLDLGDLVGSVDREDGSKILGHVFGDQRAGVETALAERTGASQGMLAQLLPILATMVLSWLGRRQRQGGLDAGGLGDLLGQQRAEVGRQAAVPDIGDLLGSVLGGQGGGGLADAMTDAIGGGGASRSGSGGLLGMLKKMLGGR